MRWIIKKNSCKVEKDVFNSNSKFLLENIVVEHDLLSSYTFEQNVIYLSKLYVHMPYEIERKFLVSGAFKENATQLFRIHQGYLASGPKSTVRVRTKNDKGYLTIKGKTEPGSFTRYEFEKEIDLVDAMDLLKLSTELIIDKYRYIVPVGKHLFEVDVFLQENEGLVVAEVELSSEEETFERPAWLGKEVTGLKRFNNSHLAKYPYKDWTENEK